MRKWFALVCAVISVNQLSWAVGGAAYSNQVLGSKAYGMGLAFAGVADDASAVYFNPAGLVQIDRPTLAYGLALEPLDSDYTAKSSVIAAGGSADGTTTSMESFTPVVPHFYAVIPFKNKLTFGFGINSPYGLETHWSQTGPLRYAATDTEVVYINFNPTLAYKLNDSLSFAAGLVYGINPTSEMSKKINYAPYGGTSDGNQKLTGDGDGWGYNLGVLLKPAERHSVGISYRSEIEFDVEGELEITNINGALAGPAYFNGSSYRAEAETELKQPQSVILGYGYRPGKWTFAIDGEWIGFSSIKKTSLKFSGSNPNADGIINNPNNSVFIRDWQNTWNLGLGANYMFNDRWEGRFGYFHHPSVVPEQTWDPSIPDSSKNGYTLGGSFNLPNFSVDLLYNLVEFHKRTIVNSNNTTGGGTANGTYETLAHIFSITFTNRFGANR